MGSFETTISTNNNITDYASNQFMDVINGYDDVINSFAEGAELTTKQVLDAVSGMIELSLQTLLSSGVDAIFDAMGINKENLQLALNILKLAKGTVEKLLVIVSVFPTGVSTTPSTKECMTALCKSYKDMLMEQYRSLKLIYDETVNAAITCMGNIIEIAKDAVTTIIQVLEDMIDEQIYKWTGYHLVEIIYMCQKGIAMYRQYKELRKQLKESNAGYDTKVSVKIDPSGVKQQLITWLKELNDALYNAFMMLMMQDIIQDLKEDLAKLTNIDIKLIAEDINCIDDLVKFLEELGLNDDTPGLALTEIINRGLNGIASTVSALNTIADNAKSLASPETATAMGSALLANTQVTATMSKTFEFFPEEHDGYTSVCIEIYKDPSTKKGLKKQILNKLESIKYDKKRVFENSQIKKIIDNIILICNKESTETEFNITGKISGLPKLYKFSIVYAPKDDKKDKASENNTVLENESNPELDIDRFIAKEEVEDVWTTAEKKKNTFQIIKMLFNTLKPMCPLLKELARLIENYKINKAKVQGNGHRNLNKGLKKILDFLGVTEKTNIKDKNIFTVRTYKLYTYCIDNLLLHINNSNMAELDETTTNRFIEHLNTILAKNVNKLQKGRITILYFDKDSIDIEKNALEQGLSYKKLEDGYMTNMDNIRVINDTFYFTKGGKSTLTSQIMRAIQRRDDPYKNNIKL